MQEANTQHAKNLDLISQFIQDEPENHVDPQLATTLHKIVTINEYTGQPYENHEAAQIVSINKAQIAHIGAAVLMRFESLLERIEDLESFVHRRDEDEGDDTAGGRFARSMVENATGPLPSELIDLLSATEHALNLERQRSKRLAVGLLWFIGHVRVFEHNAGGPVVTETNRGEPNEPLTTRVLEDLEQLALVTVAKDSPDNWDEQTKGPWWRTLESKMLWSKMDELNAEKERSAGKGDK